MAERPSHPALPEGQQPPQPILARPREVSANGANGSPSLKDFVYVEPSDTTSASTNSTAVGEGKECTNVEPTGTPVPRATNGVKRSKAQSLSVSRKRLATLSPEDCSFLLHNPRNVQTLKDLLQRPDINPNDLNANGDTPLHSIVRSSRSGPEKLELIVALLTHSDAYVDHPGANNMTALHIAVQAGDLLLAKVLLSFGAKTNVLDSQSHTPLDLATILWAEQERTKHISKHSRSFLESVESCAQLSPAQFKRLPRNRVNSTGSWVLVEEPEHPLRRDSRSSRGSFDAVDSCRMRTDSDERSSGSETRLRTDSDDTRDFTESMVIPRSNSLQDTVTSDSSPDINRKGFSGEWDEILKVLYASGAKSALKKKPNFNTLPKLRSLSESGEYSDSHSLGTELERSIKLREYDEGSTVLTLAEELEDSINERMEGQASFSANPDEAIAIAMQQRELAKYSKTRKKTEGFGFEIRGGSRVLVLDGGGIKGLIQIEILSQMEEATGRRITELFDWIVGTSTGGIVALLMVYAKKTMKEIRQIYFRLKEEVFSSPRAGFAYNTAGLEKLLQEQLGVRTEMSSVSSPKILIASVHKKTSQLQLRFFNNCFDDEYSKELVWKVGRYTSAAPMFFKEMDNYVDGGVLANNPCDFGLTAIQNYHRALGEQLGIALVVSVGTGIFPGEVLGKVDAQEFLFFGKHWFNWTDTLKKRTKNLISLLSNALVESEIVAENCHSRCAEQGIPFYRFSPQLDEVVATGETDNEKLIDMIIQAKCQTREQGMPEVIKLFRLIAEASRKLRYRNSRKQARPLPVPEKKKS